MMQRLVRRYSVVNNSLAFIMGMRMPIFFLMLASKGFSLDAIGMLIGILTLSTFVFEIPFGSLADRLGRKIVFLLGETCLLLSYLVFWLSDQWWWFAAAMLVNGMGKSLMSGSIDALFVEQYRKLSKQHPEQADLMRDQAKVLSRSMLAMGLGALIGGGLPWILSIIFPELPEVNQYSLNFAIMSGLVLLHFFITHFLINETDHEIQSRVNPKSAEKHSILSAFVMVMKSPVLLGFMSLQFSVGIVFITLDNLWQPRLDALLGDNKAIWLFGVVSSFSFFCMSLGQKLSIAATRVRERTHFLLLCCQILIGCIMALLASVEYIALFIAGYAAMNFLTGMMSGPLTTLFHHVISDQYRSTLLSVRSSCQQVGGMLAAVAGGIIAEHCGISVAWWCASSIAVIASMVFLLPDFKRAIVRFSATSVA